MLTCLLLEGVSTCNVTFGRLSVRLVTSIASIASFIDLDKFKLDVNLVLVLAVLENFFISRLADRSAVGLA